MFNSQFDFKIIHANEYCYFDYPNSLSLNCLLGERGYLKLLSFLDIGPLLLKEYKGPRVKDLREFMEFMRRLTIPYYEEARLYFNYLPSDEDFDLEESIYSQDELKRIIQKYSIM